MGDSYNRDSSQKSNKFADLHILFILLIKVLHFNTDKMTTTTIEQALPVWTTNSTEHTNGSTHQRRDLKTTIFHADEELYQKHLEAKGGKEDMWQGGDM
jgi:hypothetical protein